MVKFVGFGNLRIKFGVFQKCINAINSVHDKFYADKGSLILFLYLLAGLFYLVLQAHSLGHTLGRGFRITI